MIASVRLTLLTLVVLGATAQAQARSIPEVPLSTISVGRAALQVVDTSIDVVFVVRDVNTPDRPVDAAYLALGAPGTDVRNHPARTLYTRADGTARFGGGDSATLEVVVLRIGYGAVRFTLHLARRCRQTVEVYISREVFGPDAPSPPATSARAVLTTCWPPA